MSNSTFPSRSANGGKEFWCKLSLGCSYSCMCMRLKLYTTHPTTDSFSSGQSSPLLSAGGEISKGEGWLWQTKRLILPYGQHAHRRIAKLCKPWHSHHTRLTAETFEKARRREGDWDHEEKNGWMRAMVLMVPSVYNCILESAGLHKHALRYFHDRHVHIYRIVDITTSSKTVTWSKHACDRSSENSSIQTAMQTVQEPFTTPVTAVQFWQCSERKFRSRCSSKCEQLCGAAVNWVSIVNMSNNVDVYISPQH